MSPRKIGLTAGVLVALGVAIGFAVMGGIHVGRGWGTGLTLRQADGCAGGARAIVGHVGAAALHLPLNCKESYA